jgi:hypothetical protein
MTRIIRSVRTSVFSLLPSFLFLCLPLGTRAQTVASAEVSGSVADTTGGSLVNAEVTMVDTQKDTPHSTFTDDRGHYVLPNLPVGPYRLEIKASGFKNYTQSGIELQVGNNIELNVTMQVGSMSEKVEVAANVNMVETKETSVSQVIDQRCINELPLNGRQAIQRQHAVPVS